MTGVGGNRGKWGAGRGEDLDIEVGVGGQILEHRQDTHRVVPRNRARLIGIGDAGVDQEGLPDRRILAEILARRRAGEHQSVGRLEGGVGVPGQHRVGHDPEEARVSPDHRLLERMVAGLEGAAAQGQARRALDLGEIQLQLGRGHRRHGREHEGLGARQDQRLAQAIDLL